MILDDTQRCPGARSQLKPYRPAVYCLGCTRFTPYSTDMEPEAEQDRDGQWSCVNRRAAGHASDFAPAVDISPSCVVGAP